MFKVSKGKKIDKAFNNLGYVKVNETDECVMYRSLKVDAYGSDTILELINLGNGPIIKSFREPRNNNEFANFVPLTGDEIELIFKKLRQKGWLK